MSLKSFTRFFIQLPDFVQKFVTFKLSWWLVSPELTLLVGDDSKIMFDLFVFLKTRQQGLKSWRWCCLQGKLLASCIFVCQSYGSVCLRLHCIPVTRTNLTSLYRVPYVVLHYVFHWVLLPLGVQFLPLYKVLAVSICARKSISVYWLATVFGARVSALDG